MTRVLVPQQISPDMPGAGTIREFAGLTMGTTWSVKLIANGQQSDAQLPAGLQQSLDRVVGQMSHWEAGSNLCGFNRAAAGSWCELPQAFFEVLSFALSVATESNGAYDPAAGALVNLWGFGAVNRHHEPGFSAPSDAAIRDAMSRPGWRRIELDASSRRALQPGGALLDFSAVAKGYAVDLLARLLDGRGIRHYLVEVGGELRGAGMKPGGQPWWVALEQPPAGSGDAGTDDDRLLLALHGLSVATSGDYRRSFIVGERRYSHTIDPRSGYPIDNGVASVTVVHESCMAADAWSTALTVLGVEQGMRVALAHRLAARFIVRGERGFSEHLTPAMAEMLE